MLFRLHAASQSALYFSTSMLAGSNDELAHCSRLQPLIPALFEFDDQGRAFVVDGADGYAEMPGPGEPFLKSSNSPNPDPVTSIWRFLQVAPAPLAPGSPALAVTGVASAGSRRCALSFDRASPSRPPTTVWMLPTAARYSSRRRRRRRDRLRDAHRNLPCGRFRRGSRRRVQAVFEFAQAVQEVLVVVPEHVITTTQGADRGIPRSGLVQPFQKKVLWAVALITHPSLPAKLPRNRKQGIRPWSQRSVRRGPKSRLQAGTRTRAL